jgi:hypothetical protein
MRLNDRLYHRAFGTPLFTMNSEGLVDALKRHVEDAAVQDTIAKLKKPPGRQVSPRERAQSEWYKGLSNAETEHLHGVVVAAVHEAIFGLLAVLDGARKLDDSGGRLELVYVAEQRIVLNDPETMALHEILNTPQ